MSTKSPPPIYFAQFEVQNQVFYQTPLCYALVNIKPILPGHVLIVPFRIVPRLTDLTPAELTSLFTTTQKVQRMLARRYFPAGAVEHGSFNIAVQDGREAGQTVAHVHCHVIPRTSEGEGDGVYDRLQGEEGNVGGGLWDVSEGKRPMAEGRFPRVVEGERRARGEKEMAREADEYRALMEEVE